MAKYQFAANISQWCERTRLSYGTVVKSLAFDAVSQLITRSPVDTGRFRASWRISLNVLDPTFEPFRTSKSPHTGKGGTIPPDSGEATAIAKNLGSVEWGDTIYISNNLPYAQPLENGHSKQAPIGMVKITFEEIVRNLQKAIKDAGGP